MSPDDQVVLDACVLVPPTLCDLLLRLAEEPRLYCPRWSEETLEEIARNQIRLGFAEERARSWREAATSFFPEATVGDYASLVPQCRNHPKDRHVMAAAIRCSARLIVTANLRDFPAPTLGEWGIRAVHPDRFLGLLHEREPQAVLARLSAMSARRNVPAQEVLRRLGAGVPTFAERVGSEV